MSSEEPFTPDEFIPPPRLPNPPISMVLLSLFGLFLLGGGLSTLLYMGLCQAFGWTAAVGPELLTEASGRWQLRLQLGLGHILGFCIPGFLSIWLFYRSITQKMPDWRDYLGLRRFPDATSIALSLLLMLASIPLVLYCFWLNRMIPLPPELKMMESQIADDLKGLLIMDQPGEFIANMTLIALLPAIGEELVFRGVLQNQLRRVVANPWLAVLLTAMLFSAVHMQFEGFIPRVVLGFILGWLYWQTRNFWIPVIAHFFNNAIQVFGQYLYSRELSTVDLEKDVDVPWQYALMSLFMTLVLMRFIYQRMNLK